MTVYVGPNIADKPRVQHRVRPLPEDWQPTRVLSLCNHYVIPAEVHDHHRRNYAGSIRLTPIDYDRLPMCKRCQEASKA